MCVSEKNPSYLIYICIILRLLQLIKDNIWPYFRPLSTDVNKSIICDPRTNPKAYLYNEKDILDFRINPLIYYLTLVNTLNITFQPIISIYWLNFWYNIVTLTFCSNLYHRLKYSNIISYVERKNRTR